MSRKGHWRQIQREAGSRTERERQTDRKRSTAERREERGRQSSSVSISLAPSGLYSCMLSTSQISILNGLNSVAEDS